MKNLSVWKIRYLSFIVLVVLSGCGMNSKKPSLVILKHPETLDFVNCKVDKWQSKESYRKNENCVRGYQEKGYIIWGKK